MSGNQNQYLGLIDRAASAYGTDAGVLTEMARLESGFQPTVVNNWDSNAKAGTPSAGMFQFIKPTFDAYARHAKEANPQAWRGVKMDWMNPQAQALATAWAVKNGHGKAWATYDRALKKAGSANIPSPSMNAPVASVADAAPRPLASQGYLSGLFDKGGEQPSVSEQLQRSMAQRKQAAAEMAPPTPVEAASPAVATGGPALAGANTWKDIVAFGAEKFGLKLDAGNAQTTGGKHADGSYHHSGHAVDFGDAKNDPAKLIALAAWAKAHRGQIKELYYNPLGWGIKNGKIIRGLTVPGHDNHLHIAI